MEGHCSIGQSPQWAVVPMEEEEEEEEEEDNHKGVSPILSYLRHYMIFLSPICDLLLFNIFKHLQLQKFYILRKLI